MTHDTNNNLCVRLLTQHSRVFFLHANELTPTSHLPPYQAPAKEFFNPIIGRWPQRFKLSY